MPSDPFPHMGDGADFRDDWPGDWGEAEASKPRGPAFQHHAKWALLALMADLSEGCTCAGWDSSLTKVCRAIAASGEATTWFESTITQEEALTLRLLSLAAGGWWEWDREVGAVFVTSDSQEST